MTIFDLEFRFNFANIVYRPIIFTKVVDRPRRAYFPNTRTNISRTLR